MMAKGLSYTGFKLIVACALTVAALSIAYVVLIHGGSGETEVLPVQVTGKRATNGHKIKVSEHDMEHVIVLASLRSPYENEPEFENAKQRCDSLISGQDLTLRYDESTHDESDRLMAYVFFDDGRMVNEILIREGLAYARLRSETQLYASLILKAQAQARRERLGIWAHQSPSDEASYPVDPKFAEFHRPQCEVVAKLPATRRVDLKSKDEAYARGFAPCNKCLP